MKYTVDFGNVWDMLSAIGTIMAVIISLWSSKRKSKLTIVAVNKPFQGKYRINYTVENTGNVPIIISDVGLIQKRKTLEEVSINNKKTLYPNECYDSYFLFDGNTINEACDEDFRNIFFYLKSTTGTIYKSRRKLFFSKKSGSYFDKNFEEHFF